MVTLEPSLAFSSPFVLLPTRIVFSSSFVLTLISFSPLLTTVAFSSISSAAATYAGTKVKAKRAVPIVLFRFIVFHLLSNCSLTRLTRNLIAYSTLAKKMVEIARDDKEYILRRNLSSYDERIGFYERRHECRVFFICLSTLKFLVIKPN